MSEQKKTEPDDWSMSDEREFIETLLCERFNFFLVIFGATLAGVIAVTTRQHLLLLLWVAAVVQVLMMLTLWRAQYRLNLIFDQLKADQPSHPAIQIGKKAKGPSVRRIIGYGIPTLCTASVLTALVLAHFGLLKPASGESGNSPVDCCSSTQVQVPERSIGSGQ